MEELKIRGERILIRPDRSLYWPAKRMLAVADLHFGKAEAFRADSVPVPGGPEATLARLGVALRETGAERLVVLGDFWHSKEGRSKRILGELARWRADCAGLEIDLVRGNHDRAGEPPQGWGIGWETRALVDPPFCFAHYPTPSPDGYVLAGHLHPGVTLQGRGREKFRFPCFWFGALVGVLPAFGDFTGTAEVQPSSGDHIYAIADSRIFRIPTGSRKN
jgi:DNA ligase-associated metallophosphoesterase